MSRINLIDPNALRALVGEAQPTLIDTRSADAFWQGHLPGARHLDAQLLALLDTQSASLGQFQILLGWILGQLGITAETPVVIHGAATEPPAARVAWALAYVGIRQVSLLNGGLAAADGIALTQDIEPVTPVASKPIFEPQWLVTAAELQTQLDTPDVLILDARDHADFLGEKSSARRHGRLPGARHWDFTQELDADGRLKDAEALRTAFRAAGVTPEQKVVVYCGSGPRSSRTFLALDQAGYERIAVYPASWNEWGNREDLPIATA
jgi:thiosulfate/3-mercaptopyruvate sulfurtransferase